MSQDDTQKQEEVVLDPESQEMADAGVFYGRAKSKTNPRMKPYILANRNNIEILDVDKIKIALAEALGAVKQAASRGGTMILLGTQPAAILVVRKFAEEFGYPVVTRRWLGGSLTNFKVISRRVEYWKKLKSDLVEGKFKDYTKKERLDFEKEAARLDETLSGLENMTTRPELLLVIDPVAHRTAVLEAIRLNIPVVALTNTDADPDMVTYMVPGNTKARTSIEWFLGKIAEAVREGKKNPVAVGAQAVASVPVSVGANTSATAVPSKNVADERGDAPQAPAEQV